MFFLGLFFIFTHIISPCDCFSLKGAILIRILAASISVMFLAGCATHLTESGRKITVVSNGDSAALKGCRQVGAVSGDAASLLSGGEYGVIYATKDARNKAGKIADADTLGITANEPKSFGGQVTGIVYTCLKRETVVAQPVSAVSQKDTAPLKNVATERTKDSGTVFEKAKKCQIKGGVWVNDSCVIQID
jgi:hypothetical protein